MMCVCMLTKNDEMNIFDMHVQKIKEIGKGRLNEQFFEGLGV